MIKNKLDQLIEEVKGLLHSSRDCLRNKKIDTSVITFDCRDDYYAEAWGMLKTLRIFFPKKYKIWPSTYDNKDVVILTRFFSSLKEEVLKEENFGGSNECNICVEKWGKDGAGRTRDSVKKQSNSFLRGPK